MRLQMVFKLNQWQRSKKIEFESKHQNAMAEWEKNVEHFSKWSIESSTFIHPLSVFAIYDCLKSKQCEIKIRVPNEAIRVKGSTTATAVVVVIFLFFDMLNTDTRCCYSAAENKIKWPRHEVSIEQPTTVFCCKHKQLHSHGPLAYVIFNFQEIQLLKRAREKEGKNGSIYVLLVAAGPVKTIHFNLHSLFLSLGQQQQQQQLTD